MKIKIRLFTLLGLSISALGSLVIANNVSNNKNNSEVKAAYSGTYYNSITATGGQALLGQLHDLMINTHTKYTSYTDCKTSSIVYKLEPGSTSNYITDFYTQKDITKEWEGGNASGEWNREHVWCQSHSIDNATGTQLWGETYGGSDLHHLRPIEHNLNSKRNNNRYGNLSDYSLSRDSYKTYSAYDTGTDLGGYCNASYDIFEPIDTVKGDVARILMYVYTHYSSATYVNGTTDGTIGSNTGKLSITDIVNTKKGTEVDAWNLLLSWNTSDPVDAREITRNEEVAKIQGNRNPFIDHPEYADKIFNVTDYISVTSSVTLDIGETYTLSPISSDGEAKTYTYTSNANDIASVSNGGVITANKAGNAIITTSATINGHNISATTSVIVNRNSSDPIVVNFTDKDFTNEGNVFSLDATPSKANSFESADNARGIQFTGGNGFSVTSKDSYNDISKVTLTVAKSGSGAGSFGVRIGSNSKVTKNVPSSTTPTELEFAFTSGQSGYVTVSGEASKSSIYIKAIKIEFRNQNIRYVEDISLDGDDEITLEIDRTYQIEYTIYPANADNQTVSFESSNTDYAIVNEEGLITGVNPGTSTITVKCLDGSNESCSLTVNVTGRSLNTDEILYFEKVTGPLEDYRGFFMIVYETGSVALNGSLRTMDVVNNGKSVTISNQTIAYGFRNDAPSIHDDDCIFYAELNGKGDGHYSICALESGLYIGNNSDKDNGLSTSSSRETLDNTIAVTSEGVLQITGAGGRQLGFNKTSDQKRFRYFGTTQQPVTMYRAVTAYDKLASWSKSYLHMDTYNESLGYCNDDTHHYYSTAKQELYDLQATYGDIILEVLLHDESLEDAKARYEMWASYNQDVKPYEGNTIVYERNINEINENNGALLAFIITSISLVTLGSFVLIKKKKHN